MTRLLGSTLLALLVGCQEEPLPLVGAWALPLSSDCSLALEFDHDRRLVESHTCAPDDEDVQVERHEFTYEASDEAVSATLERSSCPGVAASVKHAQYLIDGSTLQLSGDFAPLYIRLKPVERSEQRFAVNLGCFEAGEFVEHALEDVTR
jgi:hypothetical protein